MAYVGFVTVYFKCLGTGNLNEYLMKEKVLVEYRMLPKYKHKVHEVPNEGHQLFMAFSA